MTQLTAEDEARRLAYKVGLLELTPIFARLIAAERAVAEQATQIAALQSTCLKLKHGK